MPNKKHQKTTQMILSRSRDHFTRLLTTPQMKYLAQIKHLYPEVLHWEHVAVNKAQTSGASLIFPSLHMFLCVARSAFLGANPLCRSTLHYRHAMTCTALHKAKMG
jgi:hypothetical protein